MVHSRSGRRAGLTNERIRMLDALREEHFDAKTWAAISYAREWALTRGCAQNADTTTNFERHYSNEERETINGLIVIMDFANRFNNTLFGLLDRRKIFANNV